jgi:hypothetical protein
VNEQHSPQTLQQNVPWGHGWRLLRRFYVNAFAERKHAAYGHMVAEQDSVVRDVRVLFDRFAAIEDSVSPAWCPRFFAASCTAATLNKGHIVFQRQKLLSASHDKSFDK